LVKSYTNTNNSDSTDVKLFLICLRDENVSKAKLSKCDKMSTCHGFLREFD